SPPPPEVPVFGTFFRAFLPMVTATDIRNSLLLLSCAILNIVVALGVMSYPSLSPFRCDDPSLQESYDGEVLKMPLFMALVFAVSTITIGVLEVGRSAPVLDRSYWLGRILRRYIFCLLILNLAVCVAKVTVNSKRPHFIDSCKPAVNTSNGTLLVCTGEIIITAGNASSVSQSLRDVDAEPEETPRQRNNPTADVDGNIDEVGIESLVTEKNAAGPALSDSSNTVEYISDNTSNLERSMTAHRRRWKADTRLVTRQENTSRSPGKVSRLSDLILRGWNRPQTSRNLKARRTSHNLKAWTSGTSPRRLETTRSTDHGPGALDEPDKHIKFGFRKTQSEDDETNNNETSHVVKDFFCAGKPEAVSRSGLSFPSGHVAAACYSGSYVIGYIIRRGDAVARKSIRLLLIVSLLTASRLVAVIRVVEGMHRWWDVLAGMGLGDCWAILLVTWPIE
ncbi:unnamed protein product, partial [Ixodes hexagonus]